MDGLGVPQHYAEAMKWYLKAAEQGHVEAQYLLGRMYWKGKGAPQNNVQAHKWLNLAAAAHKFAIKQRDIVAEEMSPADILEAQELAREWFEKHGQ